MFQLVFVFLSLAWHGVCWEIARPFGPVNCSFGPTGLGNLRSGYTRFGPGNGSFRSRSVEGVNIPVPLSAWVIRYIEVWQLTRPDTVELLAIHDPVRDPCLSDLSKRHDLNSGVFCGAESTAPSCDCARHRYLALSQYTGFWGLFFHPDFFGIPVYSEFQHRYINMKNYIDISPDPPTANDVSPQPCAAHERSATLILEGFYW